MSPVIGLGIVNVGTAGTPVPISANPVVKNVHQMQLIPRSGNAGRVYIKIYNPATGLYTNATADGLVASQPIEFTAYTSLLDITTFFVDADTSGDGITGFVIY